MVVILKRALAYSPNSVLSLLVTAATYLALQLASLCGPCFLLVEKICVMPAYIF